MSPGPTLAPTPTEQSVALGTGTQQPLRTAPGIDATRAVLAAVFGSIGARRFAVRFWDGTVDAPVKPPEFTMLLARPGAVRRMLLPPSGLSFAHAYMFGDVVRVRRIGFRENRICTWRVDEHGTTLTPPVPPHTW